MPEERISSQEKRVAAPRIVPLFKDMLMQGKLKKRAQREKKNVPLSNALEVKKIETNSNQK